MFETIKAVALDVDGVMTDGTFWWGTNGDESKRFYLPDLTGVSMARDAGIKLALISGESSAAGMTLTQRLADKLKITDVYKGCHDKAGAVREFAERHGIALADVCFIGDDIIDLPAFAVVGLAVAPANAQDCARAKARHITKRDGGQGAVRETMDAILNARSGARTL
jgi:3-deoxy-D-manno-octulosonate 8-phosphate phosphatase (KDO 8-P phosphatase)